MSLLKQKQIENLVTDLAARALDALVLHLAGAETVTGSKTFNADQILNARLLFTGTSTVLAGADGFVRVAANTVAFFLNGVEQFRVGPTGISFGGIAINSSVAFDITKAITAASGAGLGLRQNQTLTAAANNDILVGRQSSFVFNNGSFTGVLNYIDRILANGVERWRVEDTGRPVSAFLTGSTNRAAIASPEGGISASIGLVDPIVNQSWGDIELAFAASTKYTLWGTYRGQLTVPAAIINRTGCLIESKHRYLFSTGATAGVIPISLEYGSSTLCAISPNFSAIVGDNVTNFNVTVETSMIVELAGATGTVKATIKITFYSITGTFLNELEAGLRSTNINLTTDQILRLTATPANAGNSCTILEGRTILVA